MDTDMLRDESTAPADIPGLVAQARAAYQQNRIKECLALTKAALLVDPGNMAALEMQSAVRFDMQRDLSDARALLEESRNKPEAQKYRKAAEIILLKALYLDPDSEGAKTLLSSIRSVTDVPTPIAPTPAPVPPAPKSAIAPPMPQAPPVVREAPPVVREAPPVVFAPQVVREAPPVVREEPPLVFTPPVVHEAPAVVFAPPVAHEAPPDEFEEPIAARTPEVHYEPVVSAPPVVHETPASVTRAESIVSGYVSQTGMPAPDVIPFTVGTSYIEKPGYMNKSGKKSGSRLTVPIILVAIAVLAGGVLLSRQKLATNASASTATTNSTKVLQQTPAPASYSQSLAGVSQPSNASNTANSAQSKTALAGLNAPPSLPGSTAGDPAPATNTRTTAAATGSLAVSSAIAAEIYMGDKLMGSTPTTLQLPTGNQTLEYRHGDLRAVVTHAIKANQTTTALVVFDAVVQLNARPWANVFIEGPSRMPLGQTPLSDVRLPVGSVLVFENPNFPSKSHKIAPDDKAIQMVFP